MNILIVPSWYPTESRPLNGIFFKEQAQALQKHGHNVTVAYQEYRSIKKVGDQTVSSGVIFNIEDGIKTYRLSAYNYLPHISWGNNVIYNQGLKKLYRRIQNEQGKPDVIHAHSCLWGGWAAAKLSKKENIPFVISEHSSNIGKGLLKKREIKDIIHVLNTAKKVIVVGPNLKKELLRYLDKNKITLIPNMVDTNYFNINTTDLSAGKNFRFFSAAFLKRNKGMDILLKAFAKSFKGENVQLIIGGDGEERIHLEWLKKQLGLNKQVELLGELSREELKKQMQLCNAFVLASRYETFGVVYIEALSCGKPIIATECGGPQIIVNEQNGVTVPVDDVDRLSNEMKKMVDTYHKYDSKIIRKDCVNRFSQQAITKEISNVYYETVKETTLSTG